MVSDRVDEKTSHDRVPLLKLLGIAFTVDFLKVPCHFI